MQKHVLILSTITLASIGIYGYRYMRDNGASVCPNLCKKPDETFELNHTAFIQHVNATAALTRPYHLLVFVDPDRECLACLFETEFWLAPMAESSDYAVHFFIPNDAPPERVEGYLNAFHIVEDQVTRFDPGSALSAYYRFGLLKVLYHVEDGILWFEGGNQEENVQHQFLTRLRTAIRR